MMGSFIDDLGFYLHTREDIAYFCFVNPAISRGIRKTREVPVTVTATIMFSLS
jgi:hypothetical protein